MRGLTKVAALLSSTWATAFVIRPSSTSGGVIAYEPSTANAKFTIDQSDSTYRNPTFEFSVTSTERSCGETNIKINGQSLDSKWEGKEAHGQGFLDVSESEAIWSITCLYSSTSLDNTITSDSNVVHLLRLHFEEATEGFAISYTQAAEAAIIRFTPRVIDESEVTTTAYRWRQPSVEFDHDLLSNHGTGRRPLTLSSSFWQGSQYFLTSVSAFRETVKEKILSFTGCLKHSEHSHTSNPSPLTLVPLSPLGNETRSTAEASDASDASDIPKIGEGEAAEGKDFDSPEVDQDASSGDWISSATSQPLDSTKTLPHLSAAETRSLHTPQESNYTPSTTGSSPATSALRPDLNHTALKVIGLTLILLSVLVWCLLRCKDPRWRAERAARREEQRTKRLYKIAAQKHKIRTFFDGVRTKFHKIKFAGKKVLMWNEKLTEVSDNEEILQHVVEINTQGIGIAHRTMSDIIAAEEGRNEFEYEAEGSQRRRSVSTLPGYESDGGSLPPYEAHRSFVISNPVNGGMLISAEIDSNPDSSVVSTSPRFSRDGTNSDFDEKIEALSLDRNPTIGHCR